MQANFCFRLERRVSSIPRDGNEIKGKALNSGHTAVFKGAGIAIDPKNGDLYVADGENPGGNHRVVVFDRTGKFLR